MPLTVKKRRFAMDKLQIFSGDLRCEEKCAYEFAECVETEDGASICKTRERNCFDDCQW